MSEDVKGGENLSSGSNRYIIGLIADFETVVGFLLAGVGEYIESHKTSNYMMVSEETPKESIDLFFRTLCVAKTVGVILIGSEIYAYLRSTIDQRQATIPIVIEIPSRKSLENQKLDS